VSERGADPITGLVPPEASRDPETRLVAALGLEAIDRGLLREALTHRSFVNETEDRGVRHNERLEFLGDAVIDLVVSTELMQRFPDAREGELSRLRSSLVSEPGLSSLARRFDLGPALRLGRGEEITGGRERSSLLCDAVEALFGAVYLSLGYERVRALLGEWLVWPEETGAGHDPKTVLQERIQADRHVTPRYRVTAEEGPDHDKLFSVEILCGDEVIGAGQGRTKKDAERQAASAVLARLGDEGWPSRPSEPPAVAAPGDEVPADDRR
jgi:ribonuclease-3